MPWDEGGYSVAVTDLNGRTVSNPAWLFVLSPPVIVAQPANSTNTLGSTATFTVTAIGPEPLHYQWREHGSVLPGANIAVKLGRLAARKIVR